MRLGYYNVCFTINTSERSTSQPDDYKYILSIGRFLSIDMHVLQMFVVIHKYHVGHIIS